MIYNIINFTFNMSIKFKERKSEKIQGLHGLHIAAVAQK